MATDDLGNLNVEPQSEAFWRQKSLDQMNEAEWEALCDGCGQCCLLKLEDEDTGKLYLTRLACRLLDVGNCRCTDYDNRHSRVPDCLAISPANVSQIDWLPDTCAYRLIANGHDLAWWHPLVSGCASTVHQAGVSVRNMAISETKIAEDDYIKFIVGSNS
ncbi:MAG: YcgN family cysteine cluster protein [Hyphomicrobiaceae bacterium]